ncbi:hypothetical protein N7451_005938 [Penicillium sp. IBT 35674x]|nr:hypothetical protein N7451_005938 [Penicillium sp. IBT 35674x]
MNLNAIRLAPSLGYISAYRQADAETSVHWLFPGLAQSQKTCEWLWKCQYAAVAADSPAFECTRMSSPASRWYESCSHKTMQHLFMFNGNCIPSYWQAGERRLENLLTLNHWLRRAKD